MMQQQPQPPPQGIGEFYRGPPPPMRQPSASSTNLAPDFSQQMQPPFDAYGDSYAAKRMRKMVQRRTVDYTSTAVRYIQARMWQRNAADRTIIQPTPAASLDMLPTAAYSDNPSTSFAAKFVHASTNKNRCSINCVLWTPTGRRLITGSASGEFTLWNGQSFNFEMILQAHELAIRSMVWSNNENWMVTGDDGGVIKYWQSNMNNVKANKTAHKESVRDLSFCRTDLKFCSCSDDTTIKVWDFARCQEERSLIGHGWDVKCVDWHPTKSLLVSGGKDNLVKLWDARSGRELSSFHGHKNPVLRVKWNQNGNWLLSSSKDQIIKLYDIRSMKELQSFRGHSKDVTSLAWHPFHEEYFVSGSSDGAIFHWLVGHETPQVEITGAHDHSVWDLAWHPIGYLLSSGSNDHTTKFWCRNRPGDQSRDKYTGSQSQGYGEQQNPFYGGTRSTGGGFSVPEPGPPTPGPFSIPLDGSDQSIPGLDSSSSSQQPPLPPGPHPSLLNQQQTQFSQQLPTMPLAQLQPPAQLQQMVMPRIPFGQMMPPINPPLPPMPNPMMMQNQGNQMMQNPGNQMMQNPANQMLQNPGNQMMQNPGNQMMQNPGNQMMGPPPHMMQQGQMPQMGGGFPNNNMQNVQPGMQSFPMFNRPQTPMAQLPGMNAFQPGMMDIRIPGMGLGGNIGMPPPPPPQLPNNNNPSAPQ